MSTLKVLGSRGLRSPNSTSFMLVSTDYSLVFKAYLGSQAPNRANKWSERQRSKDSALQGPRVASVELEAQPSPLAAIELLKKQPVAIISGRVVSCDGDGLLGHPKVFINLVHLHHSRLPNQFFARTTRIGFIVADTAESDIEKAPEPK